MLYNIFILANTNWFIDVNVHVYGELILKSVAFGDDDSLMTNKDNNSINVNKMTKLVEFVKCNGGLIKLRNDSGSLELLQTFIG